MGRDLGSTTFEKHDDRFLGIYRGEVLDNVDPLQYGRIKVKVYPMMSSITDSTLLPWAAAAQPIFDGSGADYGTFAVPMIGTKVWVFFEQGSVYQPVYFAEAPDAINGLPSVRTTNYPNRKVWRTSGGVEIYIDDTSKEIKLTQSTGTTITLNSSGDIIIVGARDVTVNNARDTVVQSTGDITIKGNTVNINP